MKTILYLPTKERIAVNNIFCIGRNYAAHAKELGNTIDSSPVIFIKPTSAVILEGEKIVLPAISDNVHHEAELCLLIGKDGKKIPRDKAMSHLFGYGVGLDLTMRDLQNEAKSKGLPWTISKGFDTSACLSSFIAKDELPDPQSIRFALEVNGVTRQKGNTSLMIFNFPFMISYLSSIFTLSRGDIIFTGTPEGVAQINSRDVLKLSLEDKVTCTFEVE